MTESSGSSVEWRTRFSTCFEIADGKKCKGESVGNWDTIIIQNSPKDGISIWHYLSRSLQQGQRVGLLLVRCWLDEGIFWPLLHGGAHANLSLSQPLRSTGILFYPKTRKITLAVFCSFSSLVRIWWSKIWNAFGSNSNAIRTKLKPRSKRSRKLILNHLLNRLL